MPASPANKKAAEAWFREVKPNGSTALFTAMHKALEYATAASAGKKGKKVAGGADTIFLLSDGSPTGKGGGKPLPADEVEDLYQKFVQANAKRRCVVHAIGIGPKHSRQLMERFAKDTGGEYRAVGMK